MKVVAVYCEFLLWMQINQEMWQWHYQCILKLVRNRVHRDKGWSHYIGMGRVGVERE